MGTKKEKARNYFRIISGLARRCRIVESNSKEEKLRRIKNKIIILDKNKKR